MSTRSVRVAVLVLLVLASVVAMLSVRSMTGISQPAPTSQGQPLTLAVALAEPYRLPPCATDSADGEDVCWWDAAHRGDRHGESFVVWHGTAYSVRPAMVHGIAYNDAATLDPTQVEDREGEGRVRLVGRQALRFAERSARNILGAGRILIGAY